MEILIRLQDGICPAVESNPLRGYIVALKPDGHVWGQCECPPEYGTVSAPGLSPDSNVERERAWRMSVDFALVSADYAADAFAYAVSATAYNARTGEGKLTQAQLLAHKAERLFESWGATGVAFGDNSVTFNVRIADAYRTSAFWGGADLGGLAFSEVSYDQATGTHRVRIDYSGKIWTTKERDDFRRLCEELTTFVSINTGTRRITVDIRRAVVRDNFIDEVKRKVNGIILRRRRFRLSEVVCQQIEAAGGRIVLDPAGLSRAVIDHLTE